MQESVYKALRKQRTQKKEMQIASDAWKPLKGFEDLVFVSRNGKASVRACFSVCT